MDVAVRAAVTRIREDGDIITVLVSLVLIGGRSWGLSLAN
jgi:hypothetical protein